MEMVIGNLFKKGKKHMVQTALLLLIFLTSCGYTDEEKQQMEQYKEQGEINAVNYIQEKYGVEAIVADVTCEKVDSGPIPDFSPAPTGNVFVTFEMDAKSFLVMIAGDQETTEGRDNYQLEDIRTALEEKIYEITAIPSEELFVCYGEFRTMDNENGMINTYFDGENLAEVFEGQSSAVVVSYINQEVTGIDMETVAEQTGIVDYLLVDYDSKAHYDSIESPYYNIAGSPIDFHIDNNLLYVNGYRLTDHTEDVYVSCEKTVVDDIVLITEHAGEQVSITKTTIDDASEWNGHGFRNAKQVFDAYALDTDSDKVYIYVPVDKLEPMSESEKKQAVLIKQCYYEGETDYSNVLSDPTDDGNYIGGIIYTDEYTDIKFSVFTDQENADK